jgi:hypothetical protein
MDTPRDVGVSAPATKHSIERACDQASRRPAGRGRSGSPSARPRPRPSPPTTVSVNMAVSCPLQALREQTTLPRDGARTCTGAELTWLGAIRTDGGVLARPSPGLRISGPAPHRVALLPSSRRHHRSCQPMASASSLNFARRFRLRRCGRRQRQQQLQHALAQR